MYLSKPQLKKDSFIKPIQFNPNIGRPHDVFEQEADSVASRIIQMGDRHVMRMQPAAEEEPIQMKCRECEHEEEIRQQPLEDAEKFIQPNSTGQQPENEVSIQVRADINRSKGHGNSIDRQTQNFMGNRFGTNFNEVIIHNDDNAHQLNSQLNSKAFTVGNDIYFNQGNYNPKSSEGKRLIAHELTHVVQQKGAEKSIQRKLTVEDDYPQDYVDFAVKNKKGKDKSKGLTKAERLSYVSTLLGKLSSNFSVESSGEVKPVGNKKETDMVKDSKATASCCMHILTRDSSTNDWKILVADTLAPHTFDKKLSVLINSELSPVQFGTHTTSGQKHMYDKGQVILGHELCGHAALMELDAHPKGKRAVSNVHDPTINIENEIAKEQGEKKENLRGLANSGFHRGESFASMVIDRFKLNLGSIYGLPASERNKMQLLSDMIRTHDMFVEIRGHSDNQGSEAAKQEVSDRRAVRARKFLIDMGVNPKSEVSIAKDTTVPVNRFVLKGLSDKEPPEDVDPTQQDRFRRVEVFVASFPWALSEMPPGISKNQLKKMELKSKTKDTFQKPGKVDKLKSAGTPCEKLLIGKAYK